MAMPATRESSVLPISQPLASRRVTVAGITPPGGFPRVLYLAVDRAPVSVVLKVLGGSPSQEKMGTQALRQSVWTRLRNPSLRSGQALSRKVELFL